MSFCMSTYIFTKECLFINAIIIWIKYIKMAVFLPLTPRHSTWKPLKVLNNILDFWSTCSCDEFIKVDINREKLARPFWEGEIDFSNTDLWDYLILSVSSNIISNTTTVFPLGLGRLLNFETLRCDAYFKVRGSEQY